MIDYDGLIKIVSLVRCMGERQFETFHQTVVVTSSAAKKVNNGSLKLFQS